EKRQSSNQEKKFNVQRFLRKRWMLPAIYLGAAAIVLSAFFLMQNLNNTALEGEDLEGTESVYDGIDVVDGEAVPVTSLNENIKLPVANESEADVVGYFYDYNSTPEEQQAALVYYNNTYYQNKGVDFAAENGDSFDVTA